MRILHVAPLVTPTNAYGGPITVALGQCRALQNAGHDVLFAAGYRDYLEPPAELNGVRARLFPAYTPIPGSAFGGLTAPTMLPWVRRAAHRADIVHIHLARDLLTLPVAAYCAAAGIPFVVQTHGMVVESDNRLAAPLDLLMTADVMRKARHVFCLTEAERSSLTSLFPTARLTFLRNGIALPDHQVAADRAPREILFLARVQQRKRPLDFVAMARTLAPEFPDVRFRMVGPDEGQGEAVERAIRDAGLGDRLTWEGPLPPERTAEAMRSADLYVLPSVDEPYPMSVLEALAHGLPTVITDTCGLATIISRRGAGAVVSEGAPAVTAAVRRLLADAEARAAARPGARPAAGPDLAREGVVEQLLDAYANPTRSPAGAPAGPEVATVAVIIATAGRPEAVSTLLTSLAGQTRLPDDVIVVTPDADSEPAASAAHVAHRIIRSERGLTRQRNTGLQAADHPDVVVFFDDDALPRADYLERLIEVMTAHPEVVAVTGRLAKDGVPLKRALTMEEMRDALAASHASDAHPSIEDADLYGCNMAMRAPALADLSFDERLPLYSWLEDLDMSRRLRRRGRVVRASSCVAAHQGNAVGGRGKHARFGYSSVVNPVYLARKGTISLRDLPYLIGRPMLANVSGSLRGDEREWRRERLHGMSLAVADLARGRILPERAARL